MTRLRKWPIEKNHFLACSFDSWFPLLEDLSFPSKILPVPTEFLHFLLEESIFIPPESRLSNVNFFRNPTEKTPDFKAFDFELQIREALSQLCGPVFVKLNWSSPRDAKNISFAGLECKTPADIYLLLKSSGLVSRDISFPFQENPSVGCDQYSIENHQKSLILVLRKHIHIDPCREFRCFVMDWKIVAVSQRDISCYYPFLSQKKDQIWLALEDFFKKRFMSRLDDEFRDLILGSFVLDVYFEEHRGWSEGSIKVVDVNAFHEQTDPLLYDWDEIIDDRFCDAAEDRIRLVKSENDVKIQRNLNSEYPLEFIRMMDKEAKKNLDDPEETSSSFSRLFQGIRFQESDQEEEEI